MWQCRVLVPGTRGLPANAGDRGGLRLSAGTLFEPTWASGLEVASGPSEPTDEQLRFSRKALYSSDRFLAPNGRPPMHLWTHTACGLTDAVIIAVTTKPDSNKLDVRLPGSPGFFAKRGTFSPLLQPLPRVQPRLDHSPEPDNRRPHRVITVTDTRNITRQTTRVAGGVAGDRARQIDPALRRLEELKPEDVALCYRSQPTVEFGSPVNRVLETAAERADLIVLGVRHKRL